MKKYRIIVVGTGNMAGAWMEYPRTRDDIEFVALVDPVYERAVAFRDRHGLSCPIFASQTEALEKVNANLIFNITPPAAHKEVTIEALEHGCHVFSEKPLADNMENSLEMIRTARRCNREFFVMQNRRFIKPTVEFKSLIDAGTIGNVGLVVNEFYMNPGQGTFRDQVLKHGLLSDMAIHQFDMMRYIFDVDPISVYCDSFQVPGSYFHGMPAATAIFQMTKDIRFVYVGYWASRVAMTTWEGKWRAIGEKGVALWDENNVIHARVQRAKDIQDEKRFSVYDGFINYDTYLPTKTKNGFTGHPGCIESMFQALDEGKRCMTDCSDNLKSIAMVYTAIQSAEEGQKVSCLTPEF